MNTAFLLMLGVTACYTVSSLSDKYAASKAKFSPNEYTFLMCSSMSVFLLFSLPFQEISFDFSFYAFLGVMLTALCKLFEFKMCSAVLREMSAFELKAWLGITLFVSYFTDILFGEQIRVLKLLCLGFTAAGLVMIVHSDKKEKVNYNDQLVFEIEEFAKSTVCSKVEHVFGVVKRLFRLRRTRYHGLRKQQARFNMIFALANLYLADKKNLLA